LGEREKRKALAVQLESDSTSAGTFKEQHCLEPIQRTMNQIRGREKPEVTKDKGGGGNTGSRSSREELLNLNMLISTQWGDARALKEKREGEGNVEGSPALGREKNTRIILRSCRKFPTMGREVTEVAHESPGLAKDRVRRGSWSMLRIGWG